LGNRGSDQARHLSATPISHPSSPELDPSERLYAGAESLLRTLSQEDVTATRSRASSLELIVDGYAHVLALDVERKRREREIASLAHSGDPQAAGELRALSAQLVHLTATSKELRGLLDAARIRIERRAALSDERVAHRIHRGL
jgi:hypothetical protein